MSDTVITAVLFGDDEVEITFRELSEQSKLCCEQRTRWINTKAEPDRVAFIQERLLELLDIGLEYQRDQPFSYTRGPDGQMIIVETAGEHAEGVARGTASANIES